MRGSVSASWCVGGVRRRAPAHTTYSRLSMSPIVFNIGANGEVHLLVIDIYIECKVNFIANERFK
jgi:hypothetical protein